MPLKLNVGVSRKLGLPAYSSIGASCHLELDLESNLIRDPDGFHAEVRDAFVAARRAVEDELARLRAQAEVGETGEAYSAIAGSRPEHGQTHDGHPTSDAHRNGVAARGNAPARPLARPGKPATANQVRAIVTIARRQRSDLEGLLGDLGVARAEDLSLVEASTLIDQLKAAAGV